MRKYIIAIDAGTTGNRAVAFSKEGRIASSFYYEFSSIYPKPGWVEQDPLDIWRTTKMALVKVIEDVGGPENVNAIGITNQRETTILWDRKTGKPLYNAIVWQCRRTAEICKSLYPYRKIIKEKTGLFLDPYFSATKIKWLIENVEDVKKTVIKGDALFGTVDTWLLWNLTRGKAHSTDSSNASRTMLFNINTLKYDEELLRIFNIPAYLLPEVKDSNTLFGYTNPGITGKTIPITGILGDQQAALFAQGGWNGEIVKNTYGTGLFVVASTGKEKPETKNLINTIAFCIEGKATYAIEGSVFSAGSILQWLKDNLGIIQTIEESGKLANSVYSNGDIYFVPALTGLGAPYWDSDARGLLIGLTRSTKREHIVRAALESIAFQARDVIEEIKLITKRKVHALRVDGGASKNDFLMQLQADILNMRIERAENIESTSLGVAEMAGLSTGFWSFDCVKDLNPIERVFAPSMDSQKSEILYQKWKKAVKRSLKWVSDL